MTIQSCPGGKHMTNAGCAQYDTPTPFPSIGTPTPGPPIQQLAHTGLNVWLFFLIAAIVIVVGILLRWRSKP